MEARDRGHFSRWIAAIRKRRRGRPQVKYPFNACEPWSAVLVRQAVARGGHRPLVAVGGTISGSGSGGSKNWGSLAQPSPATSWLEPSGVGPTPIALWRTFFGPSPRCQPAATGYRQGSNRDLRPDIQPSSPPITLTFPPPIDHRQPPPSTTWAITLYRKGQLYETMTRCLCLP